MSLDLPLVYDYGASGHRVVSFSIPVIIGTAILMLALGFSSFFLPTSALSAVVLLPTGGWMTLVGLHLRRDRTAFSTRYVLSDTGIDITLADSSTRSVPWSDIALAYQSRLLRYFRIESPSLDSNAVLIFGAPPRLQMTGQVKYLQTGMLLRQTLGDRLSAGWV